PDSSLLAVGDGTKSVFVNLANNSQTPIQSSRVLAISNDNKTICNAEQSTASVTNLQNGTNAAVQLRGHGGFISEGCFTADDKRLLTAGVDGTIRIWDVPKGKELVSLIPLDKTSWCAVDPEGRFDTNDLRHLDSLHWIRSSSPFKASPLE